MQSVEKGLQELQQKNVGLRRELNELKEEYDALAAAVSTAKRCLRTVSADLQLFAPEEAVEVLVARMVSGACAKVATASAIMEEKEEELRLLRERCGRLESLGMETARQRHEHRLRNQILQQEEFRSQAGLAVLFAGLGVAGVVITAKLWFRK